jgi:hypothetical protein
MTRGVEFIVVVPGFNVCYASFEECSPVSCAYCLTRVIVKQLCAFSHDDFIFPVADVGTKG